MKIRFNKTQLKQLAEISGNLGILFFASAITQIFAGVDEPDLGLVILGVLVGCVFFVYSLILLKGFNSEPS